MVRLLEPDRAPPGRFVFDTFDTLLDQLDGDEEVWLTLCSSSPWATRQPTDFLPASPAHDIAAYAEFVRRVVSRGAGRVRYWQCDNEPSNGRLLWAATADDYVRQLEAMYRVVNEPSDPNAQVVLGGCGYDVFSSEATVREPRRFFDPVDWPTPDAMHSIVSMCTCTAIRNCHPGLRRDRASVHARAWL